MGGWGGWVGWGGVGVGGWVGGPKNDGHGDWRETQMQDSLILKPQNARLPLPKRLKMFSWARSVEWTRSREDPVLLHPTKSDKRCWCVLFQGKVAVFLLALLSNHRYRQTRHPHVANLKRSPPRTEVHPWHPMRNNIICLIKRSRIDVAFCPTILP